MSSETDPNGLSNSDPGAKLDDGKIQARLLKRFGLALLAVADLATGGAKKYSPNGWATVENGIERYDDACIRHMLKEDFEAEDPDMNQPHCVSEAWNALAKLQLIIEKNPAWVHQLLNGKATKINYE